MRHDASSAEQNFLSILNGDTPLDKTAVDLDPDVAEALGIPSVSPSTLNKLEGQVAQPHGIPVPRVSAPAPEHAELETDPDQSQPEEEPQEGPPLASPESVEVDGYDRTDAPPVEEDPAPEPPLPTRATHGRLFMDKRAYPLQMLTVLTTRYGTAWADWESDTLWWALRRDFGPVGEIARNKIMALRLAATTDTPWLDWDVFEDSGLAWNDIIPLIGTFQPMTPMQTAFAVHVLQGIRPDEPFDDEVTAYIAAIIEEEGFVYAPAEYFANAQGLLDRKVWLTGFRQEVMQAWEALKDVDPTTITWREDHPLDIHILKLMAVKHYVDGRDAMQNNPIGASANASTTAPPVP
jgi:hypothetical protein